jgi:RimJ/RimL family protein N-acetyltransferase
MGYVYERGIAMVRIILPTIHTKRLLLRPIKRSDAPAIFEYAHLPNVGPSAGWKPHQSIDDTYRFVDYAIRKREFGQPGLFAIVEQQQGNVIGTIEIHSYQEYKGEIGFVLHPQYWNQGYITEAAKAVIVYAMDVLELKRLTYCHFPENNASKRVCEKLEFRYEGTLRNKFLLYDGTLKDDVTYSITSEEYQSGMISWVESFKKDVFID